MENSAETNLEEDEEGHSKWKIRFGCMWLIVYFCMSFFEMFAIYDWLVWKYELNSSLSIISAVIAGFTPGLGSLLAYIWGY